MRLARRRSAPPAPGPEDEGPRPPRGASVARFAGILDGQSLWVAVDATPGTLALRDTTSGDVLSLPDDAPDDQPAYTSIRVDLGELPGTGEASYDVVVVPRNGRAPRPVWTPPLADARVAPARDERTQFALARSDSGTLQVRRTSLTPTAWLSTVTEVAEGVRLTVTLPPEDSSDAATTQVALLDGDDPLATFPTTYDETSGQVTVVLTAPTEADPAADVLTRVVVGSPGAWRPVRRHRDDVVDPGRGVPAPAGPASRHRHPSAAAALRRRGLPAGPDPARRGGRPMRIAFCVFNLDGMGGTSRSAVTQANALAPHHDVRFVSVTRSAEQPHYHLDPSITVEYLVDVRDDSAPSTVAEGLVEPVAAKRLHARESALVPERWDRQFTALCDVALEAALPRLEVDVAVTVTPGLLACATQLLPDRVIVVHQEHRSSSNRTTGLEPLLTFAPQADVVALLTPTVESWLLEELGAIAPPTVVRPNPLPIGFAPRSRLDNPLIVAAGRMVQEKQFAKLVSAFAQIADRIPQWRLRIYGEGPGRLDVLREIRKHNLWDRVELPGKVTDMSGEWAKASVSALTSRSEGFPLVVQEAMAAGVPVASFDCASGPREIIEHEVNGLLVAPESVGGMAAALLRLCTDDELRLRLGTGAARSARQYDAHALAERWVQIFGDARARRAGRGRVSARALARPPRTSPPPGAGVEVAGVTPARARHDALDWSVRAASRSGSRWFVIPAHGDPSPVLVVPMDDRDAFLAELGGPGAPAYLSGREPAEHGWHERRAPLREMAEDLRRGRSPVLHVEPWPTTADGSVSLLAHGCTLDVEFWETGVSGDLLAARRNRYADRVAPEALADLVDLDVEGVTRPDAAADGRADRHRVPLPDRRRLHLGRRRGSRLGRRSPRAAGRDHRHRPDPRVQRPRPLPGPRRAALLPAQHRPLRPVGAHHPPGHRRADPALARRRPPRINLVDHRDILPAEALPTFNSHAIETSLHRIEGLAEHFVYFNDDVFLGRPARPETFFSPSGSFATFFSHTTVGLRGPTGRCRRT